MNELHQLLNKAQDEGLTFEEKRRVEELKQPYQPKCRCDTLGEGCKLHGIKYDLSEVDPWLAS